MGTSIISGCNYNYRPDTNILAIGRNWLFKDGKWATIIKQDKFAELKEAHRNGAVIQSKVVFVDEPSIWEDVHNPTWNPKIDYRIKPEEKPKVGDVVKALDSENGYHSIGVIKHIEDWGYFLNDGMYWDNAKTLTQQEAIDLLFNNK